MISEFQELSDKIDQLAELTVTLRRENAQLRQEVTHVRETNAALAAQNVDYQRRASEAVFRLDKLLAQFPEVAAAVQNTPPANEEAR
jgi:uncharacterized coiled-coil DUF342 family protein